jgi:uncharacterized protein YlxP (DUF503 family)
VVVGTARVVIYAPWVHSLKEKRSAVKSLCGRVRSCFNVSIAEVDAHDAHQSIVLGFACVCADASSCDSVIDHVLGFMDENTEGQIVNVEREIL